MKGETVKQELREELKGLVRQTFFPSISEGRYEYLKKEVLKIPELMNSPTRFYLSREGILAHSMKYSRYLIDFKERMSLTDDELGFVMSFYSEASPVFYNQNVFKNIFKVQASETQRTRYEGEIESSKIMGAFAQTEIGHGSNVKAIETTATFDKATDCFVLHSPTLTSTKWMVGTLGLAANYAIVVARLITNGTDHGPHPFFVQLRDTTTHEPLQGVQVGDCGPKFGVNSMDNGFLKFEFHRVPREALLNSFSSVNSQGEYSVVDPNGIKRLFFSLIELRVDVAIKNIFYLSKSALIAIRYSLVRRQFPSADDPKEERLLIDFQIHRHKLFSGLATAYATLFMKRNISKILEEGRQTLEPVLLQELHAVASMYKSFVTDLSFQTVEMLRRACGGHGFLINSGFSHSVHVTQGSCTYDGDNTVLALQTIKYILKLKTKGVPANNTYSVIGSPPTIDKSNSKALHRSCFALAAYRAVEELHKKYTIMSKKSSGNAIDEFLQIEGVLACSTVFAYCFHQDFCNGMEGFGSPPVQEALEYLRQVLAINQIRPFLHLINDTVNVGQFNDEIDLALKSLRPLALPLAEAFGYEDCQIDSILGKKDGRVYEELYRQAIEINPVNHKKVFPGMQEYLRPKL